MIKDDDNFASYKIFDRITMGFIYYNKYHLSLLLFH